LTVLSVGPHHALDVAALHLDDTVLLGAAAAACVSAQRRFIT
jgi:hypothetical protein